MGHSKDIHSFYTPTFLFLFCFLSFFIALITTPPQMQSHHFPFLLILSRNLVGVCPFSSQLHNPNFKLLSSA
ncbi:hypothetical protein L6452_19898 [Arctium lappa]|uniref:Uncharacterized protein n=1 Tax=Arctium lappa TaxID=4217 RepID=A0ACB9BB59_ARCLA|nr:hypothetical protein L6452_19898 [Arctium lappa]